MTTGLPVFDTTVSQTNAWLADIEGRLRPCSRTQAYDALRAVLHELRDRLPLGAIIGLSAQLPMLVRGVFLEGWRPGDGPTAIRSPEVFHRAVAARLPSGFPREASAVVGAVFLTLSERLDAGEIRKIIAHLPAPLRALWPSDRPAA